MEKTDHANQAFRAMWLLFVLGGFLFWAVWICVGLFDPHLGWGERLGFILGAPFVFVIMAITGGPSLLLLILSADRSPGQSDRARRLAEVALLCGPLSVARFRLMAALLREVRSAKPTRMESESSMPQSKKAENDGISRPPRT